MKIKLFLSKISIPGVIAIIWVFFFITVNFMWHKIDHRPARWDESAQLYMSEYSYQKLQKLDFLGAIKIDKISSTKAGGVPLLSAIGYFIFGDSMKNAIFILISFSLTIITFSIYNIGKNLFSPLAGLLSSILFICFQGVFLWYKYYLPDLPLTATVTLTILLIILIYKNKFRNNKLSALLGGTMAIGMCIKHLYVIYVFLPLLFIIITSFFNKKDKFIKVIKKQYPFYILLFLGILIGVLYNILNFGIIREQLFRNFQHSASGTSWYVRQNPKDYINTLIDFISFDTKTRLIFPILFVIGLVFSFIKINKIKILIYLWIVGSFLSLLYLIYSTMPYYFLPVLPAISLLIFSWVPLKLKKFNIILTTAKIIFIIPFFAFILNNFLLKNLGTNNILKILQKTPSIVFSTKRLEVNPLVDNPYWINAYVDGNVATLPYPHYWYVDEMIEDINNYSESNKTKNTFDIGSMITEYEWTTAEYMNYKIFQKRLNTRLNLYRTYAPEKDITIPKFLSNYDFIITKTGKIAKNDFYGGWGDPTWAFNTQKYVEELIKNDGKILKKNNFILVKSYNLPDGSIGQVWGKLFK